MSKDLKILGENIIIKAVKKDKGIIVVENNSPSNQRKWVIENTEIYDFGDKIKKFEQGQKVVLDPRTPVVEVHVEKLLGIKKDEKDREKRLYFAVKEENIIAVLN